MFVCACVCSRVYLSLLLSYSALASLDSAIPRTHTRTRTRRPCCSSLLHTRLGFSTLFWFVLFLLSVCVRVCMCVLCTLLSSTSLISAPHARPRSALRRATCLLPLRLYFTPLPVSPPPLLPPPHTHVDTSCSHAGGVRGRAPLDLLFLRALVFFLPFRGSFPCLLLWRRVSCHPIRRAAIGVGPSQRRISPDTHAPIHTVKSLRRPHRGALVQASHARRAVTCAEVVAKREKAEAPFSSAPPSDVSPPIRLISGPVPHNHRSIGTAVPAV